MSLPTPDVIVIRGAPAVGKTTLSKELAKRFPKGVRLEVDTLRNMVISVDWTNQQEHKDLLQVAAQLTLQFLGLGFKPVIVVDTFSGDKVKPFLDAINEAEHGLWVKTFALYTCPEVLCARLAARSPELFRDFVISKKLNSDVLKIRRPDDTLLDTGSLTEPQIVGLVFESLKSSEKNSSGGSRDNTCHK